MNTANAQTYMHVINTGTEGIYDVDLVPVVTFTTTDVVVDNNGTAAPYVMVDVSKIVFNASSFPLSVEEIVISTVGIFPNPTNGVVTLDVINEDATEFVVDIYNVTGSLVSSTTYPSNGGVLYERVDLSSYVNGIYMIRINSGNDIITNKILKK